MERLGSKAETSKSTSRLFTTTNAIRLILLGSAISSVLFVYRSTTLHYQPFDQLRNNFENGIPKLASSKTSSQRIVTKLRKPTRDLSTAFNTTLGSRQEVDSYSTTNKTSNGCLNYLNSPSWLEEKRLGNQNSEDSRLINDDYVASSILNAESILSDSERNSQKILEHTICAESSRFRNLKFSSVLGNGNSIDDFRQKTDEDLLKTLGMTRHQIIEQLSVRLFYLSLHVHQHRHSIAEAKYRLANPEQCEPEMVAKNVGKFDFECPDAKFLVVPMKKSGLGSQMRLITTPALRAGVASDRVVLFVNQSPSGPYFLRNEWYLSSCPRHDKQCFFLPDSPCVATQLELHNATALSKGERRLLFKTGTLPGHLEEERVVLLDMVERPARTPENFRTKIVEIARKFIIDPLAKENPADPIIPLLHETVEHMLQEDEPIGDSFHYSGRNSLYAYAFMFYAMRPRGEFADRINHNVHSSLGDDHQTHLSLGLPIRASDKCREESECPTFETYMSLIQSVWERNKNSLVDDRSKENNATPTTSIILTSESPDVFKAQRSFQENIGTSQSDISFPFKFVTNAHDILQDTGHPSQMSGNETKEEILVSSLSSFKIQFYAKYNVGNCCSLFHTLLIDFLKGGCGASDSGHLPLCMQDHEEERFQICCAWTKSERCKSKREQKATAIATIPPDNTSN